jgi:hypothetical protein
MLISCWKISFILTSLAVPIVTNAIELLMKKETIKNLLNVYYKILILQRNQIDITKRKGLDSKYSHFLYKETKLNIVSLRLHI